MSRRDDRDGIYLRELRDLDPEEDSEPWMEQEPPPAPRPNYAPRDEFEEDARDHFADMICSGALTERQAERAYRAFVRRRRSGGSE